MAKAASERTRTVRPKQAKPTKKRAKPPLQPAPPELRRVPTQARSKERFERILDAADAVFADVGFDAATMDAIAERAGTSIGSVYQFFPNKKALFEALCTRYLERAQGLFESLLVSGIAAKPWPELVDAVIDAFWRFHVDLPGFRAVWAHQNISVEMLDASDTVNRAIAERSEEVIHAFAPHVPKARRSVIAQIAVETVSAMLFVAVRRAEPEAKRLVDETKVLLKAYFAKVMEG
jgi:AcrR family transcriptional regulator